jgi:ribonuclease R
MDSSSLTVEGVVEKHDIPVDWPGGIDAELERVQSTMQLGEKGRLDLRDLPFVTIDGVDAQDFDDAVYGKSDGSGWKLWVAIADVSYFVRLGSQLDQVAQWRGNSVYFPNRVIPMLPKELSNNICSLIPGQDRYVVICEMKISKSGQIQNSVFHQAVISSHARLTYDGVNDYLQNGQSRQLSRVSYTIRQSLDALCGIVQALTNERDVRGSLDLEIPSERIEFSDLGGVDNVCRIYRNDAHRLIEECMLAANFCVARILAAEPRAGLYRVHEEPASEDIAVLRQLLEGFGVSMPKKLTPTAGDLSEVLRRVRPEVVPIDIVQTLLLRSMRQAVYSKNKGPHFALGYPVYTHFTSPIRRYADLVVHRLLKQYLGWEESLSENEQAASIDLSDIATHCSFTDRRAESATREVTQFLKSEFMGKKIGAKFKGFVSGVTEFGIFVQLTEFPIDGMVHISKLGPEYFLFDRERNKLTGKTSGRVFQLGGLVNIVVARVNCEQGHIDFSLEQNQAQLRSTTEKRNSRSVSRRPKRKRRRFVA